MCVCVCYLQVLYVFDRGELWQPGGEHEGEQGDEEVPVLPQDEISLLAILTEAGGKHTEQMYQPPKRYWCKHIKRGQSLTYENVASSQWASRPVTTGSM